MPSKDEIKKFSTQVEQFSKEKKLSILETLCWLCETNRLETTVAASLISPALKSKLRTESEALNLIKKRPKLPI